MGHEVRRPDQEKFDAAYASICGAINEHGGYTFEVGRVLEYILANIIYMEERRGGSKAAFECREIMINNIDLYFMQLVRENKQPMFKNQA